VHQIFERPGCIGPMGLNASCNNDWKCAFCMTKGSMLCVVCVNIKVKVVPLQAWTGPEGS